MKILKNRKIAITITVAVVLIATVFGVHKSLNRLARDIEAMFYKEGYMETNLDVQLNRQAEAVLGVVTITKNYPKLEKQTETLRRMRQELLAAESIGEKGYAELRMYFALEDMFTLGTKNDDGFDNNTGVEFSERDNAALKNYFAAIMGAGSIIDKGRNLYNAEVEKFQNGELYSPLARILKPFAFVTPPELFINAQM